MNRRKLIGLVASVLVAGLGTLVLLKYANSSKGTPAQAIAEPTVPVLKVQRLIPKGTPAEQLADAVAVEQIPASQKLNDAADNVSLLTGLVASTDLLPSEQVVKARFIPAAEQKKLEIGQGSGLIGVWITLEPIRALNGRVQINDTVAVFGSFSGTTPVASAGNEGLINPTTHLSIHKVPVLDVVGNTVVAVPTPDGQAPATVPPAPTIQVKLGLSAADAERLVFAASYGAIWLGAEDLDVAEDGTKIVDRSNIYIETPKTGSSLPPAQNPVAGAAAAKTVAANGATPAAVPATQNAPAPGAAPTTTVATKPATPAGKPAAAPAKPAPASGPAPTVAPAKP